MGAGGSKTVTTGTSRPGIYLEEHRAVIPGIGTLKELDSLRNLGGDPFGPYSRFSMHEVRVYRVPNSLIYGPDGANLVNLASSMNNAWYFGSGEFAEGTMPAPLNVGGEYPTTYVSALPRLVAYDWYRYNPLIAQWLPLPRAIVANTDTPLEVDALGQELRRIWPLSPSQRVQDGPGLFQFQGPANAPNVPPAMPNEWKIRYTVLLPDPRAPAFAAQLLPPMPTPMFMI